jgi:hypothetical protein
MFSSFLLRGHVKGVAADMVCEGKRRQKKLRTNDERRLE